MGGNFPDRCPPVPCKVILQIVYHVIDTHRIDTIIVSGIFYHPILLAQRFCGYVLFTFTSARSQGGTCPATYK